MRKLFLRFYLTVVICFLASALLIGAVYKQMLERINRQYLNDVFQSTIIIVENELGALPQSLWHDEIARLRNKLPVPVNIEEVEAYKLNPSLLQGMMNGETLYLPRRNIYIHRIPDTQLVIELGPVAYLSRLDSVSWPDAIGLLLMCAALGVPTWLWLRPFWRDLLTLIRQSRKLGTGDFGARTKLEESSPLEPLSGTINRMAQDIEELSASRQAMIDSISHDVRTPLARLRYRLEAVKAGAPVESFIGGAERDLEQMDQLVEEWLTLRTLERPEMKPEPQPFEALPWLTRQLDELAVNAAAVAFVNATGEAEPWLWADRYYLGRALGNLVNNARRYGGGQVRVTFSWHDGVASLEVEDDGPGIPEDARERLLKPFERLEGSRNRSTGGHGLGLAITDMIMKGHGGELRIGDSELGGARMTLSWPSTLTAEA
ncbi:ATP-binding protein [Chitiniphilus eburneus]|uniref:histidine kinase n=1 Tax=Chitiniphilus eburneus TaxID=2571148 RepID=A0A4V5MSF7_9NEIS|nr:ATP-binding protein [Chitiniphilus eburneus]TJZ77408.1 two-component system sensor histidine kinase RstB [Chitiniphilus eburneus]